LIEMHGSVYEKYREKFPIICRFSAKKYSGWAGPPASAHAQENLIYDIALDIVFQALRIQLLKEIISEQFNLSKNGLQNSRKKYYPVGTRYAVSLRENVINAESAKIAEVQKRSVLYPVGSILFEK